MCRDDGCVPACLLMCRGFITEQSQMSQRYALEPYLLCRISL
jgi:hypothetical protein